MDVDTGITSEVFTIKSETKLIDIFNNIINKKSEACLNYIDSLNLDKNTKIVVVGTYFTGVGIVKKLRKKYDNILLIDIYPHLKELLDTDIGGNYKKTIEFSTNLELINSGDVVIDTTGFGGLTVEQSSEIIILIFLYVWFNMLSNCSFKYFSPLYVASKISIFSSIYSPAYFHIINLLYSIFKLPFCQLF